MATDWKTLTPILQEKHKAGATVKELATEYALNKGSVSRALRAKVASGATRQTVAELQDTTLDGSVKPRKPRKEDEDEGEQALSSQVIDKATARRRMNDAIAGRIKLDPTAAGLIKTALKDELEPEVERNPYAGTPEDELAERALVLACSVLGVKSIAARLALMLKHEPGMLDLLGDEDAIPQEAQELDSPVVTTTDDEGPQSNVLEAAKQLPRNLESDVLVERRARNSTVIVQDVGDVDTSGDLEGK